MNQLVFIENQQVVTDSLTIADMFGKEHFNVLQDIKKQMEYAGEEFGALNFQVSAYRSKQNKEMPKYHLTEEAFTLVVFSYNTKEAVQTKIKFIQEFKRMREFIESQQQKKFTAREQLLLIMQANEETAERVDAIEKQVNVLHDTMRIDGRQEHALKEQGKAKVFETLGGYGSPAYEKLSRKVFHRMWGDFKRHFLLPRSMELPKVRFDEAVRYIAMWRPDTSTAMEIDSYNKQTKLKLVQ